MREGWQRLKYIVDINSRDLEESTDPSFEFRYVDIGSVGRGALLEEPERMAFTEAPSRARRLVRSGDAIVSTVRTYLRAVWPVKGDTDDMVVSTGFAVLTPRPGLDARYLGWIAQSDLVIDEIVARSVGVSYPAINGLEIGDVAVPVPPVPAQRSIADYLDVATTRIDALVGTRSAQEALVQDRQLSMLSWLLVPSGVVFIPLRRMAVIQSGLIVDSLRDIGDDPVTRPYLRVANVQPGRLELESVTQITVPRGLAARCTLSAGDVLMTEGGDLDKLGRGTVWREELPGALHQNHIFAVRPVPGQLDPDYLGLLTQTAHARAYFESTGVRTTNLASTNSEKIMSLPIPRLDLDEQRRLVREARTRLDQMAAFRESLRSQAGLLLERRQALITAAVTGQIEIPGVAA